MRAKRSKKYRKIMSSYTLHFSFRTPYQVLCDSNFLRQCHAFHMPVQKSLENTLHGEARPYVTQCSLAKAMAEHRGKGRGDGKPMWLPPPLEVPLRYCKHRDSEGAEVGVVDEAECLVDLIAGQPKGNEAAKNKNHYVLATAEDEEGQDQGKKGKSVDVRKRKRGMDVREAARQVPGVPIVYVKRSVMILEELSGISERLIRGVEKAKFKEGLVGDVRGVKRKRGDGESSDESDVERKTGPRIQPVKRAKGPNPLSMRKKKVRTTSEQSGNDTKQEDMVDVDGSQNKKKRRRRHGKRRGDHDGEPVVSQATSVAIEATV